MLVFAAVMDDQGTDARAVERAESGPRVPASALYSIGATGETGGDCRLCGAFIPPHCIHLCPKPDPTAVVMEVVDLEGGAS